jgi:putative transposase
MKKSRFTEAQIAFALRQAESGTPVAEIIRKLGIAEQTFYLWEKTYAGMGVAELRRLRQLEDENRRLKRLVADLTLDKQMLQDVLSKKF